MGPAIAAGMDATKLKYGKVTRAATSKDVTCTVENGEIKRVRWKRLLSVWDKVECSSAKGWCEVKESKHLYANRQGLRFKIK